MTTHELQVNGLEAAISWLELAKNGHLDNTKMPCNWALSVDHPHCYICNFAEEVLGLMASWVEDLHE